MTYFAPPIILLKSFYLIRLVLIRWDIQQTRYLVHRFNLFFLKNKNFRVLFQVEADGEFVGDIYMELFDEVRLYLRVATKN